MQPITLYKKDSKDKIRFFTIFTEGAEIVQQSGIDGTDSPVEHRKVAKAKNVGRANATTPAEQAVSEAESTIADKIKKGYFQTKEEAENEEVILPMLAKSFDDHSSKIDWSKVVIGQPKLDGMRCLAIIRNGKVKLQSRGGVEIQTVEHIKEDLVGLPDCVLDGELYAHGYTFQENMSMVKKYRPGISENVKFHLYDLISDEPFLDRYNKLLNIVVDYPKYLNLVENIELHSKEELDKLHTQLLSEGYEGTILRHGNKGYKVNGRCDSLLKFKDFIDEAAMVVDIEPSDARPEQGVVVCILENGKTFKANPKLSHEEREELLRNKEEHIGKTAEIRFFEWTDDGIPRFPVFVGFRLDK